MKKILITLASLFCVSACGGGVDVGGLAAIAGGGSGGADSPGAGATGAGTAGIGGSSSFSCPPANTDGANDPAAACVTWTDPTAAADCSAEPTSIEPYQDDLAGVSGLLVGRWQRCTASQIPGEDVGVEFSADGKYYPLTFDAAHAVVRRLGVDYEGTWSYIMTGAESATGAAAQPEIVLSGVTTDAPTFTRDPRQMRILFSPVPGRYIPLTP